MRQRGFSIIEIAVTLVVLGMVLASAVPSMSAWVRNARLRNQSESVLSGLQMARNEALRRNRPVSFYLVNQPSGSALSNQCVVSATGGSWVVSVRSPDGACAATPTLSSTNAENPLIVTSRLGTDGAQGVSVSAVDTDLSTAASSITFDALGRRSAGIARITINYASAQSNDRPMRVDIGPSGNVRACDPTITSTDDPRRCL
jgi:type IV fimbrial biogenesis protein FimT